MNRWDKGFILIVLLGSISLFASTRRLIQSFDSNDAQAIIYFRDKEVQRLDMNRAGFYTVKGILGDVVIEIDDGKVRVAQEKSPLNYCSLQGWINKTNTPIVCLPNGVVVVINSLQINETDVDLR